MNEWLIFAILGAVQGATEFLPISSTGHLILVREVLSIPDVAGLAVDAVLQLATALAVIAYFWKDIRRLALSAVAELSGQGPTAERNLLLALAAGTVPAMFLGLLLESTMETTFRSAELVAYALLAGSVLFVCAEYALKKIGSALSMDAVTWKKGLIVGLFQSIALIPGMSRSGMTISGGLFLGLSRETAARFGFLLSVPIILGSGIKKLLELYTDGALSSVGEPLLLGGVVSFVTGLLAIHALLLFVRTQPLYLFAGYRVLLAIGILLWL